jgi:hypothetical protein
VDVAYSYMIGRVFKTQKALEAFMAEFGWKRTVKREPWHFALIGRCNQFRSAKEAIAYIDNKG